MLPSRATAVVARGERKQRTRVTRRVFRSASKTLLSLLVLYGAALNACKHREAPPDQQARRQTSAAAQKAIASGAPAHASSKAPRAETAPQPIDPAFPETVDEDTDTLALAYAARVPLLDERGTPLPQIENCPASNSTSFQARMRLLFLAIVKDNPNLALLSYFPFAAYGQVKATADPEQDSRSRLLRALARDIHEAHVKLGANADGAEFVAIEVPDADANFVNPGSEGNKVGYFRVLHARLTYRDALGAARSIAIASLISWREEWYVMHLSRAERAGTSAPTER
jgi:hypothetical protein